MDSSREKKVSEAKKVLLLTNKAVTYIMCALEFCTILHINNCNNNKQQEQTTTANKQQTSSKQAAITKLALVGLITWLSQKNQTKPKQKQPEIQETGADNIISVQSMGRVSSVTCQQINCYFEKLNNNNNNNSSSNNNNKPFLRTKLPSGLPTTLS